MRLPYLKKSLFACTNNKTTSQTITIAGDTVSFTDPDEWDYHNIHDHVASPTDFVIPGGHDGVYIITGYIDYAIMPVGSTDLCYVSIAINGTVTWKASAESSTLQDILVPFSDTLYLNENDIITILVAAPKGKDPTTITGKIGVYKVGEGLA